MLRITEDDYNELMDILKGYVYKLNELSFGSKEYMDLKWELDNKFCGINMLQEHQIIHAELEIGNVFINKCISRMRQILLHSISDILEDALK